MFRRFDVIEQLRYSNVPNQTAADNRQSELQIYQSESSFGRNLSGNKNKLFTMNILILGNSINSRSTDDD